MFFPCSDDVQEWRKKHTPYSSVLHEKGFSLVNTPGVWWPSSATEERLPGWGGSYCCTFLKPLKKANEGPEHKKLSMSLSFLSQVRGSNLSNSSCVHSTTSNFLTSGLPQGLKSGVSCGKVGNPLLLSNKLHLPLAFQ